jgi:hypothetical protein
MMRGAREMGSKPVVTFIFVAPFTDFSKELAISSAGYQLE